MTTSKKTADLNRAFKTRERTNILWTLESKVLAFLVQHTPLFITSNMLTAIGQIGSFIILLGFILAKTDPFYLILAPIGFAINWYGDSLDGRLAYYRNTPRKWYGFTLDLMMDWFSTVFIGLGYYLYAPEEYKIIAFTIVVLYGWAMLIAIVRYKITDVYTIDSGVLGPTEVRVILSSLIMIEFFYQDTLQYFIGAVCVILLIFNIVDTRALLKLGDIRDAQEREAKRIIEN